jgi:hypothetical protein
MAEAKFAPRMRFWETKRKVNGYIATPSGKRNFRVFLAGFQRLTEGIQHDFKGISRADFQVSDPE